MTATHLPDHLDDFRSHVKAEHLGSWVPEERYTKILETVNNLETEQQAADLINDLGLINDEHHTGGTGHCPICAIVEGAVNRW